MQPVVALLLVFACVVVVRVRGVPGQVLRPTKTGIESWEGAVLNLGLVLCPSILALEASPVSCFVCVGPWDCLCGLAHFYAGPKGRMDERTREGKDGGRRHVTKIIVAPGSGWPT